MLISLDGQQTLIASLSRLRLWQVLRPQGDWLHHIDWHQDPIRRQQLGTALAQTKMADFRDKPIAFAVPEF